MTLSNRMPDSGLKFRDKLSGAIKSFLPRSDGRCAYDSGWDSAYDAFSFDPMDRERLTAGKRQHDDIQKPSLLGQSEKDFHRCEAFTIETDSNTEPDPDPSDIPQLTLAQVRQQMLQAAKKAADDASPTQARKLKPLLLNLYLKTPASPLPPQPDDDTVSEASSTCPSASGSSASLQLDTTSEFSSCTLA